MPIARPSPRELRRLARDLGFPIDEATACEYVELLAGNLAAYDVLAALPDELPPVRHPRTPGARPPPEENPLNAWYVRTRIAGAADGPLAGKRVAVKDNVCVAGVPMMNGSSTLEGYVPEVDATVVARLLDAGAEIAGKAHCEAFCLSGGSHTNATGPVRNPRRPSHGAGGSSSGSAALVAAGEVELAIGGDQGGSIRIPSAFCGTVGMKPTHGLVPYTGAMPIEITIDHLGPITANVEDNARMLEVMAGPDGLDPRQGPMPAERRYVDGLEGGVAGLRIGVLGEGFGLPNSDPVVDDQVREAARTFAKLGAHVRDVSVPMHAVGPAIWTGIAIEGLLGTMMKGNGFGVGWRGLYLPSLMRAHAAWRERGAELPETVRLCMLLGEHVSRRYGGAFYAKSQNLGRRLRRAYDEALTEVDVLLLPTVPMRAQPLPAPDAPRAEVLLRAFEAIGNTAPFDVTGHPAISIPCAAPDGLPVGVMLVGRHFEEATLYRAARAFEATGDWQAR